jgi:hypothetical protein
MLRYFNIAVWVLRNTSVCRTYQTPYIYSSCWHHCFNITWHWQRQLSYSTILTKYSSFHYCIFSMYKQLNSSRNSKTTAFTALSSNHRREKLTCPGHPQYSPRSAGSIHHDSFQDLESTTISESFRLLTALSITGLLSKVLGACYFGPVLLPPIMAIITELLNYNWDNVTWAADG